MQWFLTLLVVTSQVNGKMTDFTKIGNGGCRGTNNSRHPSYQFHDADSLKDCSDICLADPKCSGFEYKIYDVTNCQLQNFNVVSSTGSGDFFCYKRKPTTTTKKSPTKTTTTHTTVTATKKSQYSHF